MSTVKANEFVKRQTENSSFAYFSGSWEQLSKMVESNLDKKRVGDKEGSWLVPLPAEGFFSAIVKLTPESKLSAEFKPRWPGENPYIHVYAEGTKVPAKIVDIVIYEKATLGKDATTDADYEIVSINATSFDESAPMDPVTMMRNFLERPGGTRAVYSAEQFAEAIEHWWGGYAMAAPKK